MTRSTSDNNICWYRRAPPFFSQELLCGWISSTMRKGKVYSTSTTCPPT